MLNKNFVYSKFYLENIQYILYWRCAKPYAWSKS